MSTPDEFEAHKTVAYAKGFLMVSSSPLTRSSHHAGDDFAQLKKAREAAGRAYRSLQRFDFAGHVGALGATVLAVPAFAQSKEKLRRPGLRPGLCAAGLSARLGPEFPVPDAGDRLPGAARAPCGGYPGTEFRDRAGRAVRLSL
jgi:hypothetical protein